MEKLKKYFKDVDVEFVVLFGSFASSKQHTMSDVDVGIYSKSELDLLELGLIISDLELLLKRRVDVVILNDLYKKHSRLAFNITQNHQLVVCKNHELYVDFKSNSWQFYFDQKEMLDMFDKAVHKRLNNGTYAKI